MYPQSQYPSTQLKESRIPLLTPCRTCSTGPASGDLPLPSRTSSRASLPVHSDIPVSRSIVFTQNLLAHLTAIGLATSPGTCAGTCGFIRGKTHANRSPAYKSPGAYKTHEYGCQFWITRNPYGLPVQPMVSICALQQQQGGASPTP